MKRSTIHLAAALLACSAFAAGQEQSTPLAGRWSGALETPNGPLEMGFVIERGPEGWTGTADTPIQGIYGMPLSAVELGQGREVRLEAAQTGGRFEASLSEDGQSLSGKWLQRGAQFPLSCTRQPDGPVLPEALASSLASSWEGVLAVGPVELRMVLVIESTEGSGAGHMLSPDQAPDEMPITRIDFLGEQRVRVCVGSVFASFEVAPSEDGATLEGEFRQGAGKFPISLARVEEVTEVKRPQEPKPPFPYSQEEVSYENEPAGITLAGTLTLPEGEGPFPAVLLITGSGAQDRDEMIFQHRPFWVIADHLSRNGVAVLRVDDRGVGGSTAGPNPEQATTADFVGDVLSGVAFLKTRGEINARRIGLAGHSEGGVIAPMAAVRSADVAFIVLLAGTGIRGDELLIMQNELITRAGGMEEEALQANLTMQRRLFDIVLDETISVEDSNALIAAILKDSPELAEGEEGEKEIEAVQEQLGNAWIRYFIRHDPGPVLEKVRCPVLAVNGTLDLQVPCEVNLEAIGSALERGGNEDFTIQAFEKLNHLFQHCETGEVSEYGQIEETFSQEALDLLSDWMRARFVD